MHARTLHVPLSLLLLALPSQAALSPEVRCVSAKESVIGNYWQCRGSARSKAKRKGAEAGYAKCDAGLDKAWARARRLGDGACAATDDLESSRVAAAACIDGRLDQVDGVVTDTKCVAGKQHAIGKYLACRAMADSKAMKKDTSADFSKCDDKLAKSFARAEEARNAECATVADLETVRAAAGACGDATTAAVHPAPPTSTTNTTTTTSTSTTSTTTSTIPGDLIFADGFESGDVSAWSSSIPRGGAVNTLAVTSSAALAGSFGLQLDFRGTSGLALVETDNGASDTVYRTEFRLRLNPDTADDVDDASTFRLLQLIGTPQISAYLRVNKRVSAPAGHSYSLHAVVFEDSGLSEDLGAACNVDDGAVHRVVLEWAAASAPGANDGLLRLTVDDGLVGERTDLDTDTRVVTRARLGIQSVIGSWTAATMHADRFRSFRALAP